MTRHQESCTSGSTQSADKSTLPRKYPSNQTILVSSNVPSSVPPITPIFLASTRPSAAPSTRLVPAQHVQLFHLHSHLSETKSCKSIISTIFCSFHIETSHDRIQSLNFVLEQILHFFGSCCVKLIYNFVDGPVKRCYPHLFIRITAGCDDGRVSSESLPLPVHARGKGHNPYTLAPPLCLQGDRIRGPASKMGGSSEGESQY